MKTSYTITALSDVHNVPLDKILWGCKPTDFLLIAGDLTNHGSIAELMTFKTNLKKVKDFYKTIIYTGGNHDKDLEDQLYIREEIFEETGAICLIDEAVTINGIKFYGSPYTPRYGNVFTAFTYPRDSTNRWEKLPEDIDILITHGPPHGILDMVGDGTSAGCWLLLQAIIARTPKVVVMGHIHEQGFKVIETKTTKFYNVAVAEGMPPTDIRYEVPTF